MFQLTFVTDTNAAAMAKNFFPASFSNNSKVSCSIRGCFDVSDDKQAISASQLQRELIFALSGRPGILFTFDEKADCQVGFEGVRAARP